MSHLLEGFFRGIGTLAFVVAGAVTISFGASVDFRHAFVLAFGVALCVRAGIEFSSRTDRQ